MPPQAIGDVLQLHEEAEIELRSTRNLWPWWPDVITSTVGVSGLRLRTSRRP